MNKFCALLSILVHKYDMCSINIKIQEFLIIIQFLSAFQITSKKDI